MMLSPALFSLGLLALAAFASGAGSGAPSTTPGDTLVLLDHLVIKETHSIFFKSLQGELRRGGGGGGREVTCP